MYKTNAQLRLISLNGNLGNNESMAIDKYVMIFEDTTYINQPVSIAKTAKFHGFPINDRAQFRSIQKFYWHQFTIQNTSVSDTLKLFFHTGIFSLYSACWDVSSGMPEKTFEGGWKAYASGNKPEIEALSIPVIIAPQQTKTFLTKETGFLYAHQFRAVLLSPKGFADFRDTWFKSKLSFLILFIALMGICVFLCVSGSIQFFITRDYTYLWWALYLFFIIISILRSFEVQFQLLSISYFYPLFPYTSTHSITILLFISYCMFLNNYLNIQDINPKLYSNSIVFIKIQIVYFLIIVILLATEVRIHYQWGIILPLGISLINLILIILIFKQKTQNALFLKIGTLVLFVLSVGGNALEHFGLLNSISVWGNQKIYFYIGISIELFFFQLALTQRIRTIQFENQQLQKNYTQQLENDLAERLEIIQSQNKQLEEQRINTLTNEFEQKIIATEIMALRSQMNPHFIFNCLNSIKLYSLENDSQAASDYLTKFSRLIRKVLENSRSEKVSLENELETLRLYIEIEAMRFKDKVRFEINVSKDIDQQFIEIPPLLLQPFVENAIWHGLMHKEEGGLIQLEITLPEEQLLHIEIIDDGIGREKSIAYKSKSATHNKSYGMKVTNERIELINQIYKTNTKIEIIDLKNVYGDATGTRVVLNIPV